MKRAASMIMDITTTRILSVLSADLGKPFSINQLTQNIKETYGTAYYANIYNRLHDLEKQEFITLNQFGKSSIITLNFQNYLLTDLLAELETRKKIDALSGNASLQMRLRKIDEYFDNQPTIRSICSIDLEKNIRLNRLELLFLLRSADARLTTQETIKIYTELRRLQSQYNLTIDSLALNETEFKRFLESDEINPIKEMIFRKTVLLCPQAFWNIMREIIEKGTKLRSEKTELNPADVTETDFTYNLTRFGYEEFGSTIKTGRKICVEDIITALMIQGSTRRIEAVPIILAKNEVNSSLLAFLSKKHEAAGRLLGLLKILAQIRPREYVKQAIRLLKASNVKEVKADKKSILQKMTLYDA